jgi:pyridoxal phosphate enzyme (YggS family)
VIADNIGKLKARIAAVCQSCGRHQEEITVVAVAKTRTAAEIEEVLACGILDIGENRVQEAVKKYYDSRFADYGLPIKWHLVGHLQTNKVKEAVRIFDLIHSLDSLRLAQAIDKEAAKLGKVQDVLLEVKTSLEAAKFGIGPAEATAFLRDVSALPNIKVRGLMTVAPQVVNPEEAHTYFRMLRELRGKLTSCDLQVTVLSMGMSDDFEAAICEGATMLRIGRGIFGPSR